VEFLFSNEKFPRTLEIRVWWNNILK
jgi:hypothetical protein